MHSPNLHRCRDSHETQTGFSSISKDTIFPVLEWDNIIFGPTRNEPAHLSLLEKAQLFCWCGRQLKDLSCEGCSSRPFVCECSDGSTTKVSQQFSRLPKLVQENFRSLDLSRVWQKTPAELSAEERIHYGSKAKDRLQDTSQPSQRNVESAPGSIGAGSSRFVSPFDLKDWTGYSSQEWDYLLSLLAAQNAQQTKNAAPRQDIVKTGGSVQENPPSPSELESWTSAWEADGLIERTTRSPGYELTEGGIESMLSELLSLPSPILQGREKVIAGREPFTIARQLLWPLRDDRMTNDDKMIEWLKQHRIQRGPEWLKAHGYKEET